ncbi:MAG TPA: hemerythrin domain-containing protein [Solirubrobacteraceae bacterium]|nr:hemerythrin domain-containing protein [Solirubrobacteraceae bacterium]
MSGFEARAETAQGRALFEELRWVHGMIRRDLEVVERLARSVLSGLPADAVQSEIGELQTSSPLWQLKVNCLHYCRFVHLHHNLEDTAFFPTLRAANPALGPVVDKLEADHRTVADLLDEIEEAAARLGRDDCAAARRRVADGLDALGVQLLAHLDYEEQHAGPTIRRLTNWR